MFCGYAVKHPRGVERPHNFPRPLLATQQPFEQYREYFVRIHEAAVLCHCADPVGIAICRKAGMAMLTHHRFLQHAYVRLDRLGINFWKQRINFLPNRHKLDSMIFKYLRENAAPRTVHGIDGELESGLRDQIKISKPGHRTNVSGLQINFLDVSVLSVRSRPGRGLLLDHFHNCRSRRSAELCFEFNPIPVPGIMAGCDDHSTGSSGTLDRKRNRGSRTMIACQFYRNSRAGENFSSSPRESRRSESSIVTHNQSARRILMLQNI